jgi:hypothetical protein
MGRSSITLADGPSADPVETTLPHNLSQISSGMPSRTGAFMPAAANRCKVPDHQSIMLTTHVSAIGLKFNVARLQSKSTRTAKFF